MAKIHAFDSFLNTNSTKSTRTAPIEKLNKAKEI